QFGIIERARTSEDTRNVAAAELLFLGAHSAAVTASRNPSAKRSEDQEAIIFLDVRPISSDSASERAAIRKSESANSSTFCGENENPFLPSSRSSGTQPHCFETISGKPDAIASFTTNPQGSLMLTWTNAPASA